MRGVLEGCVEEQIGRQRDPVLRAKELYEGELARYLCLSAARKVEYKGYQDRKGRAHRHKTEHTI